MTILSKNLMVLDDMEKNNTSFEDDPDFVDIKNSQPKVVRKDESLFMKDKLLISDTKYSLIRKEFNLDIPSIYRLKSYRKELNLGLKNDLIKIQNKNQNSI